MQPSPVPSQRKLAMICNFDAVSEPSLSSRVDTSACVPMEYNNADLPSGYSALSNSWSCGGGKNDATVLFVVCQTLYQNICVLVGYTLKHVLCIPCSRPMAKPSVPSDRKQGLCMILQGLTIGDLEEFGEIGRQKGLQSPAQQSLANPRLKHDVRARNVAVWIN